METKYTKFIDNRAEVLKRLNANANAGAKAVGVEAVGMVVDNMESGYGKPIRVTGDLMRDVNFRAESEGNTAVVRVGNSLEYAPHVHEGTAHMRGRPYIKDAIEKGKDRLREIWRRYLSQGF